MSLTFEELRRANFGRTDIYHRIDDWSPTDWATAMAGECGEACNYIKKMRRLETNSGFSRENEEDRNILIEKAGKELADMVIYADLLAMRLGLNLGVEISKKFNETSIRLGSSIRI